jgi:ABC-type uncharacterized transport system permease subunit
MKIVDVDFFVFLLASSIRMAVPIFLASLGELFAERSGILNIGMEGMMLIGAFTAYLGSYFLGDPWLGALCAIIAAGGIGLLHAFLSVTVGSDQVVSGIVINILGLGLTTYFYRAVFGIHIREPAPSFAPASVPILAQTPIIGPIFFQQNVLVYLSYILVPLFAFILFKTTIGLKIRAVGEKPEVADTLGIDVRFVRYVCTVFGGMMSGLAGAFLSLAHLSYFTENMTAGRGFIALATVILGQWNPFLVFGGCILFGAADALQIRLQVMGLPIPYPFLLMFPYVVTIISLLVSRRVFPPKALATHYKRGEK